MNVALQDVLLMVTAGMGGIMSILLGILISRNMKMDEKIEKLHITLTTHMLEWAKLIPTMMTSAGCKIRQDDCHELVQRLIGEPIRQKLQTYIEENEDHWVRHEAEAEHMWNSIRFHHHTDPNDLGKDRVVVNGKS